MADFALLNNVDHQDVRVVTDRSSRYGDNVMLALTFPFEFRDIQAHYPILFQGDGRDGYYPVALFGFEEGENLFLDDGGWHAGYIPAMIQREPFLIGFQESAGDGTGERTRVLSIDMDHPRVNTRVGEPLFQPLGGRTTFLENTANLLETIYLGIAHNKAFVAALQEHDLLEALTFEIALKDGTRNQLIGFHCLVEEKMQSLSGALLGEFNEKGYLMPMYMALASLANVQRLVELKNKRVDGIRGK
ncbi:MAG: SapC family protein [Gammaproteobacteria bacterium]|nr:SapC family protein [Gammaproteobacteria bacterium]